MSHAVRYSRFVNCGFEILTLVTTVNTVFWVVMLSSLMLWRYISPSSPGLKGRPNESSAEAGSKASRLSMQPASTLKMEGIYFSEITQKTILYIVAAMRVRNPT
jgi:hypothetical protein